LKGGDVAKFMFKNHKGREKTLAQIFIEVKYGVRGWGSIFSIRHLEEKKPPLIILRKRGRFKEEEHHLLLHFRPDEESPHPLPQKEKKNP